MYYSSDVASPAAFGAAAFGEIVHIGNDTRDKHRRSRQAHLAGDGFPSQTGRSAKRRPVGGQTLPGPYETPALTGYEPTVSLEEGVRRTLSGTARSNVG